MKKKYVASWREVTDEEMTAFYEAVHKLKEKMLPMDGDGDYPCDVCAQIIPKKTKCGALGDYVDENSRIRLVCVSCILEILVECCSTRTEQTNKPKT